MILFLPEKEQRTINSSSAVSQAENNLLLEYGRPGHLDGELFQIGREDRKTPP
jgi:hypothetical protein